MEKKKYKQSFLIGLHILLGGLFVVYSIFLVINYDRNLLEGRSFSILIAIAYIFVLKQSAKLFNKQEVGGAYFLTISGFFVGVFLQVMTCANSIRF